MLGLKERLLVYALLLGLCLLAGRVWQARHSMARVTDRLATVAPPFMGGLTITETTRTLATLSADGTTLTLPASAPDTLRLCADVDGELRCISLLELRERRN